MKYRILLLGLLLGAAVAGVALYADRLSDLWHGSDGVDTEPAT